jgi:hypothetical protein
MDILPKSKTIINPTKKEQEKIEADKQKALSALGAAGAFTAAVPLGTALPFQNLINDQGVLNIKAQEAMRMFPQADPSMFDYTRGGVLGGKTLVPTIPLSQSIASSRVFDKNIRSEDLYKTEKVFPEYLTSQPGSPSPELGSYQQLLQQTPPSPEGSIQAVTVTPGPGPSRFSAESLERVDKLGKALSLYEKQKQDWLNEKAPAPTKEQLEALSKLKQDYIPQAGQVWGNTEKPQYSYAQRVNPNTGQYIETPNPSLYLSRFEASPFKQAEYLYTSDVETDPRVVLKAFQEQGKTTGPSWGIRAESSRAGRADSDVNFRKDLIETRGELTTGDIQALLKAKDLPFNYQTNKLTKDSSRILSENLNRLAEAEGLTPYQVIEKYARQVPAVGEPSTPPTLAVESKVSDFPIQGQAISPFGKFASKTDLRQIGILPPSDKTRYTAFNIDEFDPLFKHVYPRYSASAITPVNTYTSPIDPLDPFAEMQNNLSEVTIYRDKLRPQAANKLLDRTVKNLIEESKPIQGLGIGGLATGAIATAMDSAVIDALSRGDYQQAGTTAALNTAIGSATGGATAKGLQALRAAGYARPAATIGSALPAVGGVLGGIGLIETGAALNRAYRAQTGKDFPTRNQPVQPVPYTGPTPSIQPRMGKAVLNNRLIDVPYGSVAGTKTVGRPWWDKAGSTFQGLLNRFNAGSIIGR